MKTERTSNQSEPTPASPMDVFPEEIRDAASSNDTKKSPGGEPDIKAAPPVRRTLIYFLFSPETRLGRFLRPFLRWVAALAGLFALGMLAAYFVLYQPQLRESATLAAQLASVKLDLATAHSKLADSELRNQKAVTDLQNANDALARANIHIALLKVLKDVAETRDALDIKDGPGVLVTLGQMDRDIQVFLPMISGNDPTIANLLQNRFNLLKSELSLDPVAARSDLEMLNNTLSEIEKSLAK